MKNKLMALMLGTMMVVGTMAYANEDFNVDDKAKHMKSKFNLTDDQTNSVKSILQDYKNKIEDARKEKEQKISAVLTPEQADKWKDAMKDKKHK